MEIIPAVDIRGGRCVQLVQGDFAREQVYGDDPVAMAQRWESEGARRLHVVDLDGAKEGRPVNDAAVRSIVEALAIPVQVAGGARDAATIARWVDAGADRVVIGTLAVEQPAAVEAAVAAHGVERIAIAVDARDGMLATKGWLETTSVAVEAFMREMLARGARHFIYTDINRDGMLEHPSFDAVAPLVARLEAHPDATLVYSGGVTSEDDLGPLADAGAGGVIIGTALYDGRIDLRAAQRALESGDDW